MKKSFMLLVVLSTGIMSGAFAQDSNSARQCAQQNDKFLQVAKDYSSCNSVIGADQQACQRLCDDADKMLHGGAAGPQSSSCSPEQIQQISTQARNDGINQGRQQGRDEIIRDLSVREDYVSTDFYGINEADCGSRANAASQQLRLQAIQNCNNKAVAIKNCYVQSEKVNGAFGQAPRVQQSARFEKEDNRSTEEECRSTALAEAKRGALDACLRATGANCSISDSETMLTYQVQKPSGPRLGRRDKRVCDARVVAVAPKDLTYKCNLRISARNQVSAN